MRNQEQMVILVADDDADDRLMANEALEAAGLDHEIRFVEDGLELLQYLRRQGRYSEPGAAPRPSLILLDLNMPRMGGLEVLREIGRDPDLKRFPTVVLSTSDATEDVLQSYHLGVNSYITKPVTFDDLVRVMRNLAEYWAQTVTLPV